jgi:hypothetical protein
MRKWRPVHAFSVAGMPALHGDANGLLFHDGFVNGEDLVVGIHFIEFVLQYSKKKVAPEEKNRTVVSNPT